MGKGQDAYSRIDPSKGRETLKIESKNESNIESESKTGSIIESESGSESKSEGESESESKNESKSQSEYVAMDYPCGIEEFVDGKRPRCQAGSDRSFQRDGDKI